LQILIASLDGPATNMVFRLFARAALTGNDTTQMTASTAAVMRRLLSADQG